MYKLKSILSIYSGIILGAAMMGAALSLFLVPLKIAPGGISGLSTVLYYITNIPVGALILIINTPIFIIGLKNFNGRFLIRSFFGTLMLSAMTEIFSLIKPVTGDIVLSCIFGGALMGLGIATVLRAGGTTGGTDIVALVIRKYAPHLSIGQLFMVIDGIIIAIAGSVFGNLEIILYSAASVFVASRTTDTILEGIEFAKLTYIISNKTFEISQQIYKEMDRGVTALSSVSMYTGKNGRILLCVIRKRELPTLKHLIYNIDSNAFVIISDAKEVMGNF